jgi:hypothetical protein
MKQILIPGRPGVRIIGALTWLLTLALFAPAAARADCSHLVTSKTDRAYQAERQIDLLIRGSSGGDPSSEPRSPSRPCSGAFCSGQPGVPSVPVGSLERLADSWAYSASISTAKAAASFFIATEGAKESPCRAPSGIFHPPRARSLA